MQYENLDLQARWTLEHDGEVPTVNKVLEAFDSSQAELSALRKELEEAKKLSDFDATRIRVVSSLLCANDSIPSDDETLLGCVGTVMGVFRRKIEDILAENSRLAAQIKEAGEMYAMSELNDNGPWIVSDDGRAISSDDFTHDVRLDVSGDFYEDKQRKLYSDNLALKLNHPPIREGWVMVDDVWEAIHADLENGIKWLNEEAAKRFYREFTSLVELLSAVKKD